MEFKPKPSARFLTLNWYYESSQGHNRPADILKYTHNFHALHYTFALFPLKGMLFFSFYKKKEKTFSIQLKSCCFYKASHELFKKKKNWDIFDTDIMPMDRGAWRQFCPWSCRESDMTEWLTQQQNARVDLRHLRTWSLQRQLATLSCCVVIISFSAVEMIKFDSDAMTRALFATLCTGSLELIYYSLQVGTLKQHPSHPPAFKPMSTPFYSLFLWVLFF